MHNVFSILLGFNLFRIWIKNFHSAFKNQTLNGFELSVELSRKLVHPIVPIVCTNELVHAIETAQTLTAQHEI